MNEKFEFMYEVMDEYLSNYELKKNVETNTPIGDTMLYFISEDKYSMPLISWSRLKHAPSDYVTTPVSLFIQYNDKLNLDLVFNYSQEQKKFLIEYTKRKYPELMEDVDVSKIIVNII